MSNDAMWVTQSDLIDKALVIALGYKAKSNATSYLDDPACPPMDNGAKVF
jgi:hypothetical protein